MRVAVLTIEKNNRPRLPRSGFNEDGINQESFNRLSRAQYPVRIRYKVVPVYHQGDAGHDRACPSPGVFIEHCEPPMKNRANPVQSIRPAKMQIPVSMLRMGRPVNDQVNRGGPPMR